MSHLIVIAFDGADEAEKVRAGIRTQQREGLVSLEDTAIVSRDAEGKLHVKNEVSRATMVGTGIGVLLGGLFFPLTGLEIGALASAH